MLALLAGIACGACNDVTLARGLSDSDAKELSAQLNRRGIAVTQRADGDGDRYALAIAESAVPAAWEVRAPHCAAEHGEATASALVVTREAELLAREHALEQRLESAIQRLPHVRSATVLITLARPDTKLSDLLRPAPASATRALLSLVCAREDACPGPEQLRPLLTAAVPGLSAANLRVLTQIAPGPEPACAELGHIGPLTVTRASIPTLKLWLAASLLLHMFGALALLFLAQRRRSQPAPGSDAADRRA